MAPAGYRQSLTGAGKHRRWWLGGSWYWRLLFCLAVTAGLAGAWRWWRFKPDQYGRVVPLFENIDMTVLADFTTGVSRTTQMLLYEGLPRRYGDDTNPPDDGPLAGHIRLQGFDFYLPAQVQSPAEAWRLTQIVQQPGAFVEWSGPKLCGGYHPDWVMQWLATDGKVHQLHLCFGCPEAKLYGPGYQLYCDVADDAFNELKIHLRRRSTERAGERQP